MWNALGFGIMCGCKMNVRTRQNRRGCCVRHGRDGEGVWFESPDPVYVSYTPAFGPLELLGKLLAPLHDFNVHFRGFEERI